MPEVKLGSKVQDVITGFTGIATARTTFLYGCAHVAVKSQDLDKDGKVMDAQWFEEPQLKVMDENGVSAITETLPREGERTGGPSLSGRPPVV